jgi:glycosyltransferase involved in cell wall biosynthesis
METMREFVFLSPPNRRLYESCYFKALTKVNLEVVVGESCTLGEIESRQTIKLRARETPLLGRIFTNVAAPIEYEGLEPTVKSADGIVTVEIFSFLSKQALKLARKGGKKAIPIVWETIPTHPFYKFPPFRSIAKDVGREASGFVAASERARDHLVQLGVDESKIRTIYPGVSIHTFKPALERKERPFTILFVGILSAHKGFPEIVRAFREIRKTKRVELAVVGRGPLENMLDSASDDSVRMLSGLEQDELAKLYAESDVFVTLPKTVTHLGMKTWEEQFGFAAVEAMAAGLPLVVSGCGSLPEVVGNENKIVPEGSVGEVVNEIIALIDHPDEAKRIGLQNRKRVEEKFDDVKQSRKFEEYVVSLIEGQQT